MIAARSRSTGAFGCNELGHRLGRAALSSFSQPVHHQVLSLRATLKNAATLPMGGGKGGRTSTQGKSDEEVMRFARAS